MFAKLSIRIKLFMSLFIITLLFASTGIVTMVQMRSISNTLAFELNDMTDTAVYTSRVRESIDDYVAYIMNGLLTRRAVDESIVEQNRQRIAETFRYLEAIHTATNVQEQLEQAHIEYAVLESDMAVVIQLLSSNRYEEAITVFQAIEEDQNKLLQRLDTLTALAREQRDVKQNELSDLVRHTQYAVTGMVLVGLIISMFMVIVLPNTISRPVVAVAKAARRLAQGDLTARVVQVRAQDEIGEMAHAFTTALESTRDVIQRVRQASDELQKSSNEVRSTSENTAMATEQISELIRQVAAGTSEQSGNIESTAQALAQLQEAIEQIAQDAQEQAREVEKATEIVRQTSADVDHLLGNTERVMQAAAETQHVAREGGNVVEQTVHGMRRIYDSQSATAEKMEELGAHSSQIGEIVAVISDIADQTNLLALNAAIEAARAGQHGQGFAVVAEEVRKLAERSAASAEEITELIQSMQLGTEEAIAAMSSSTVEIEEGMERANQAGASLDNILTTFEDLHDEIQLISKVASSFGENSKTLTDAIQRVASITEANAAGSQEMTAQSEEVSSSIENISAIAEQTAASAQEVSASTEEASAASEEMARSARALATIAEQLSGLVAQFRV